MTNPILGNASDAVLPATRSAAKPSATSATSPAGPTQGMRAWQWRGPGDQGLIDTPVPTPAADELLIAVEASGLCGTDLRILAGGYGHAKAPQVIGHEFAGTVAAVGSAVADYAVGDLVAADPNVYCLACEWCSRQAYNLCANIQAIGVSRAGSMAEYVTVPARLAVKLPGGFDPALGALIEPLSCVLHGIERGAVVGGRTMAVYGAGAIGLMAVAVAAQRGVAVTVVEPLAMRRERAEAVGAVAATGELAAGARFDYVLDASGAPPAVADGLGRLRKRGTFIQMGVTPMDFRLPLTPYDLYENEWRVIGSNSVADCYERAAALMPSIAEPMRQLVTHTLPLAELPQAVELIADPAAVKVQIDPRL
ncbi:MAG: alcohol dehydrogenase catalytic domain-containing protein [Bifidobacteriaceae bacterium]|nr:alcohol dehydrogenase catalytic domain-containing protein [Bifidobacteriaceae bacterium]